MRVDRDRFILSNIDERLEKDVLYLFADHLLQDIDGLECKIDTIKPGFVLVTCNKNYGIDWIFLLFFKNVLT